MTVRLDIDEAMAFLAGDNSAAETDVAADQTATTEATDDVQEIADDGEDGEDVEVEAESADNGEVGDEEVAAEDEGEEDDEGESEEVEGEEKEEDANQSEDKKPRKSRGAIQRAQKNAKIAALEMQTQSLADTASQSQADMIELGQIAKSLERDNDAISAENDRLRAQLAEYGVEDTADAKRVRELEKQSATVEDNRVFAAARAKALAGAKTNQQHFAMIEETAIACIGAGLSASKADVRAVINAARNPEDFGLTSGATMDDFAAAIARARNVSVKPSKKERSNKAREQLKTNSSAPPMVRSAQKRSPREYGFNAEDALQFLEDTK